MWCLEANIFISLTHSPKFNQRLLRQLVTVATEPSFVEYVLEQAGLGDRLLSRKMFGEYGFHLDGKFVAMACDNSFYIKETQATQDSGLDLPRRPPYPGAKPYPVADELLDDAPRLNQLLRDTAKQLPKPKPGKRKKPPSQEPGR